MLDKNDFYPRPPRGGRPKTVGECLDNLQISIHALREEGDISAIEAVTNTFLFLSTPSARRATALWGHLDSFAFISIHALREEGDVPPAAFMDFRTGFLSTPSARRATTASNPLANVLDLFLSTPSARRATKWRRLQDGPEAISIHALREEGDYPV